mmetsp:Transcript_13622/g.15627  ORF Transcript_13622/g.15627 Transcript_13622/m.15627 type:complete len:232 (+) Transcript_13622:125-820(+)
MHTMTITSLTMAKQRILKCRKVLLPNRSSFKKDNETHFVQGSVKYFWECKKCALLPYQFRAPGSVVFSVDEPSVSIPYVYRHLFACKWARPLSEFTKTGTKIRSGLNQLHQAYIDSIYTQNKSLDRGQCDIYFTDICRRVIERRSNRRKSTVRQSKVKSASFSINENEIQGDLQHLSKHTRSRTINTKSLLKEPVSYLSKSRLRRGSLSRPTTNRIKRQRFLSIHKHQVEI